IHLKIRADFFYQAEDGIQDFHVTGVQTCALPILDARGMDATGKQVTERGNPQTGPFFVEGAEPGDMLSVTFDRLRPNRKFGWSASAIAPNVLEPETVKQAPDEAPARWEIDQEAGTATLVEPRTALDRLTLPLRPMVGCFGVAPPR